MRNLSEKRIDEALGAFRETLLAFCETVLPGGRRSGNKWICGDLHDGEGGSCAVFLDSGGFNDTNPAADHVKGGPIGLWKAIFGVSSFVEVIKGMEAWVKDGSLPDGSKGRHRAGKIEDSGGEPIVAQDAYEKNRIRNIEAYQLWIKDAPEHPHWYVRPPYEDVASYVKSNERAVEWQLSEIYAHRWQKAVENTNGIREETASELAEYRGLSRDVFLWLVDNGYIAVVYSEKFDSLEIAFPVFRNTQWFPGWPENDTQFLGMHIPYWTEMGEKRWKYEPKGCGSEPWVIGDLAAADLVVIGESNWDVIAFVDLRKLYLRGADKPWAAIATRGASNPRKIPDCLMKADATVVLLMQNDENKANDRWYRNLPVTISGRGRRIVPPDGVKDLNDWIKAVGADEVNKILDRK